MTENIEEQFSFDFHVFVRQEAELYSHFECMECFETFC